MKTNRRDAVSLARLLRAGELTAVWVPDEGHEAMRDFVRARTAAVEALRVHRQQVSAFMLKHGRTYHRKKGWTMRYLRWLQEQQFDHPAHQIALQEMVEAVRVAKERVDRLERTIEEFVSAWSLEPLVRALQTLRGVNLIVAVTFATEVGDASRLRAHVNLGLPPPGAKRAIDGRVRQAWWHHEGRQRPCSPHVGRERLDISTPAEDWQDKAIPARADVASRARDCFEGTELLDGPLPEAGCARQTSDGSLRCYRP